MKKLSYFTCLRALGNLRLHKLDEETFILGRGDCSKEKIRLSKYEITFVIDMLTPVPKKTWQQKIKSKILLKFREIPLGFKK